MPSVWAGMQGRQWQLLTCGMAPVQAKAMAGADGKMSTGDGADMAPPNYGAKYEQHVGTLQKQLEEAKKT